MGPWFAKNHTTKNQNRSIKNMETTTLDRKIEPRYSPKPAKIRPPFRADESPSPLPSPAPVSPRGQTEVHREWTAGANKPARR